MYKRGGAWLGVAGLGLLTACSGVPYDPQQVPQLQVTAQLPPLLQWSPGDAQVLQIYAGDQVRARELPLWQLNAQFGNGLRSPVRYGEVPATAQVLMSAPTLVAGEAYTLVIRRQDSQAQAEDAQQVLDRYETRLPFIAGEATRSSTEVSP